MSGRFSMNERPSDPWSLLGISGDASVDDIRRAYARKLKVTRPDEQPEAFQALVHAREIALRYAEAEKERARPAKPEDQPSSEMPQKQRALLQRVESEPVENFPADKADHNQTTGFSNLELEAPVTSQDARPRKERTERADAIPLHPNPHRERARREGLSNVDKNEAPLRARRVPGKVPSIPSKELTGPEAVGRKLALLEAAGDGSLDERLLQGAAADIAHLSTIQRKGFEDRIVKLLARRIIPNAKRRRRVASASILNDEAFCVFAVAMSEEFGWRESDRTLHTILGSGDLIPFRQFLAAMAEAQAARAGNPPRRESLEGHVLLNKLDLASVFGEEAAHFSKVMAEQGKKPRFQFKWIAFFGAPFWALKHRLYSYTVLWLAAAFLMGQSPHVVQRFPAFSKPLWFFMIVAFFLAICFSLGRTGERTVLRRAHKIVVCADRKHLFDPIARGIYLRARRSWLFLSDSLILLLTIFAFGFLINSDIATAKLLAKAEKTYPPPARLPLIQPRAGTPKIAPKHHGSGISIPRPPVDNSP